MVDQGRELRVGIEIPRLQVELPDSLPDGVQTLDDVDRVRVGTLRRGRFILLPTDAPDAVEEASASTFRTRLSIALRDARIIKGDMLSTFVYGNPTLLIENGRAVMSGALKLRGGRVDIKGRRFEIETGTITFTGDPANPNVVLTAKWQAPDDTTIFADFVGPLTTGKVTLRSDPPRSREEILALVVFGRAEGYSSGGQQADKGTQAVGMAGGFATEGLNKVLDDVTDLEIRTRVDTSSSTNPRPELEVQISQAIAARIAYVLGQIQPGQAPDKTYGTIDWNFRPEWSLETTVGDRASTTVDMIWERRY
jgi:translocation and assembly module TamB